MTTIRDLVARIDEVDDDDRFDVTGQDMPWLTARVVPLAGFDEIAPLFAEELRLCEELADVETPEWTAAYERVRSETRLRDAEGQDVAEYLLHIDGSKASWRWHDEPFNG